ncbi:hypothetical protein [Streptomyces sp. PCS3-D2]|uniref:hypothetical protein n=1 Tax=Streptomyces sp. PCS3-D2 TaxID=1460244 RepID=UPI0004508216
MDLDPPARRTDPRAPRDLGRDTRPTRDPPPPERPDGAIVATTFPKRGEGEPVGVLDLGD